MRKDHRLENITCLRSKDGIASTIKKLACNVLRVMTTYGARDLEKLYWRHSQEV